MVPFLQILQINMYWTTKNTYADNQQKKLITIITKQPPFTYREENNKPHFIILTFNII